MTDTTTLAPTDAEILDAAEDFRSQYTHGGTTFDEFDEIGFARAVLAKWGAPAPASGDVRSAAQALVDRWDTPKWKDAEHTGAFIQRLREALAAPPAQEARVPLDPKKVGELWLKSQGVCLTFCRLLEAEHGITAAQKETP